MAEMKIGGDERLRIKLAEIADLAKSVGEGPWSEEVSHRLERTYEARPLGAEIELGASAAVKAAILPADADVDLTGSGERVSAPQGKSFASLALRAGFGADVAGGGSFGAMEASVRAGADWTFEYRHLLPVEHSESRLDALVDVASTSHLRSHRLDLAALRPLETHSYLSALNLDLGLSAAAGRDIRLREVVTLFDALAEPVKAHVALSARAGLGWSLYRAANVTVSGSTSREGWVRVRLSSASRRRLSIGAAVDMSVSYDLARPLEAILDYALSLDPTADLLARFEQIAGPIRDGDWETIKQRLIERGADEIDELFEDAGWRDWIDGSDEVAELVDFARRVVDSYDDLSERLADRVRALWADVIDVSRLGAGSKIRGALEKIAALDAGQLDVEALLPDEAGRIVELLELLTGESIEDLIIDEGLRADIEEAADAARRVLDLADNTPERLLGRLEELKKRSGIAPVVSFLRENATTKKKLADAFDREARPRAKKLVERLVGKGFDRVDASDLRRIQSWAQGLDEFLRDVHGRVESLDASLRESIGRLRGELGFSMSVELERVCEKTALLDIVIDANDRRLRDIVQEGLRSGDIAGILDDLPDQDLDDDEDDASAETWTMNEALFTSTRTRSLGLSTLWNLFGRKRWARRVCESSVEVSRSSRRSAYRAGFSAGRSAGDDARTFEVGAWWTARGEGRFGGLEEPYAVLSENLKLEFAWGDVRTDTGELDAVDELLCDLGFSAPGTRPATTAIRDQLEKEQRDDGVSDPQFSPPKELDVRLGTTIRVPRAAVERFLDVEDEADWNDDFLNAAHRTYSERLEDDRFARDLSLRRGAVLAAFLETDLFQEHWVGGALSLARSIRKRRLRFRVGDAETTTSVARQRPNGAWMLKPDFEALNELMTRRRRGLRAAGSAATTYRQLHENEPASLTHDAIGAAGRALAKALDRSALRNSRKNPGFLVWLILARLSADDAARSLSTGLCTLRWRVEPTEEYRIHAWELVGGLPGHWDRTAFPL